MKTNTYKKVTAILLSTTMMLASSLTTFASGDSQTQDGVGNILAYKVEKQIVPTAMKLAINPNGFAVNTKYTKVADDAAYDGDAKYYKKVGDAYQVVIFADADAYDANSDELYLATVNQNQIVSFKYGLANESTVARTISAKFDVEADDAVTFVATPEEAVNEQSADDGGAKRGDYKIFLQLVPAKAATTITASTYAKASGDYDEDGEYYKKSGTTYTKVETNDEDEFKDGDYYVSTNTIGTEILPSELADVEMTASTAPIAFAAGTGTTYADVAYSLPEATYSLKANEFIDWDTETADVKDKFEMTVIGGIAGFTITGSMNTNTAWEELGTKTITITPTYTFDDATGLETAVDTGLNQIKADARTYTVTYTANYTGADPTTVTEKVTAGGNPTGESAEITALKAGNDGYTFAGWYDKASGDDAQEVDVTGLTGPTTVYAHWTANALPATTITSGATEVEEGSDDANEGITHTASYTRGQTLNIMLDIPDGQVVKSVKSGGSLSGVTVNTANAKLSDSTPNKVQIPSTSAWADAGNAGKTKYVVVEVGTDEEIVTTLAIKVQISN